MRRSRLRRDLAELGTDLRQTRSLSIKGPGDQRHRLAHEILQPTIAHLRDDMATVIL